MGKAPVSPALGRYARRAPRAAAAGDGRAGESISILSCRLSLSGNNHPCGQKRGLRYVAPAPGLGMHAAVKRNARQPCRTGLKRAAGET